MGWVAIVAGALIAVMFVYSWFNREAPSSSTTTIEYPRTEESSTPEKDGEATSKFLDTPPTMPQLQVPDIEVNDESNEKVEDAVKDIAISTPTAPTLQYTAPPPPPTVTLSTSSMGPPPPPRSQSPPRLKPPTMGRPPTAPRPNGSALRPPPSAASSLRVPPTKVLSNSSMAPSSLMPPPKKKASQQVILEPGHSPLDWAALTSNPKNQLRGKDVPSGLIKVTPSLLKAQNGRKGRDAWTVYQGKVYNITPYVPFHPGGKGELLRGAGKDSAKLFMEVHPWVNWDGMLSECCVGILVGEEEVRKENIENTLDEMD